MEPDRSADEFPQDAARLIDLVLGHDGQIVHQCLEPLSQIRQEGDNLVERFRLQRLKES